MAASNKTGAGAGVASFPRSYTPSPAALGGVIVMAAIMLALSAVRLWWFGLGKHPGDPSETVKLAIVSACVGFAVLSITAGVATFASATVLTADTIIRRGLLGAKSMRRSDIAGYRIQRPGNSFPTMRLTPRQAGLKALTVMLYRPDADFRAWFEGLPDLDEEDRKTAEQAVLDDPEFSADPKARKRTLTRLRHIARVANGVGRRPGASRPAPRFRPVPAFGPEADGSQARFSGRPSPSPPW